MKDISRFLTAHRLAPVYVHGLIYLAVGLALRLALWLQFGRTADVGVLNLAWILPVGLLNDIIQAAYLSLPLALYLFLLPDRWRGGRIARGVLLAGSFATLMALLFVAAAEYFFFEEFDARFNLVAFDYLMYPTEVIGDVRAEYPLWPAIFAAAAASGAICWGLRRYLLGDGEPSGAARVRPGVSVALHGAGVAAAIGLIGANSVSDATAESLHWALGAPKNRVAAELAMNGMTTFWRAARTSEIDYHAFYKSRPSSENWRTVRDYLSARGGEWVGDGEESTRRHFAADPNGLGKMNVVVVVEESLGSEFSRLFGGAQDLTPNLDAYAQRGLWFRHLYASGTRTVRGLEAITASFPPIPSVSILRRPNNEHIATWGSVLAAQGYRLSFLYGGYGYFDNMNYFFGNNGFEVLDRSDIDRVRFENIWGVSDEDLFDRALAYYDELAAGRQPFFSMVMTTSNHKPFTFREGVPGVPAEGGGRAAGVRYADFALGHFLKSAAEHSWFANTMFIVVADHGARVYGKADIPLRTYEIPMFAYAPAKLAPGRVDALMAQIDVAPTMLGLLGLEYEAPFYGVDILKHGEEGGANGRVIFFNHNYDVAAYRAGALEVLGLGGGAQTISYDTNNNSYSPAPPDEKLIDLTVALYQSAYEQFSHRHYR